MSDGTSEENVDDDVTRLLAPRADCTGLQSVDAAADIDRGTADAWYSDHGSSLIGGIGGVSSAAEHPVNPDRQTTGGHPSAAAVQAKRSAYDGGGRGSVSAISDTSDPAGKYDNGPAQHAPVCTLSVSVKSVPQAVCAHFPSLVGHQN